MLTHATHPIRKHQMWKFLKFYINYFRGFVQDNFWVGDITKSYQAWFFIGLWRAVFNYGNQFEIIVSCYGFWDSFCDSQYTVMYYSLLLDDSVKALRFVKVTLLYVKLEFLIGCTCWYYRKILWLLEIFYFLFDSM